MDEITASPPAGHRVACVGCGSITAEPIEIRCWDPGSGPWRSQFACPGCTPRYLAAVQIRQLLTAHMAGCSTCRAADPCPRADMLLAVHRAARGGPRA